MNNKQYYFRLSCLLLAMLLFLAATIAACASPNQAPTKPPSQQEGYYTEYTEAYHPLWAAPSFIERIAQKYTLNSDTVGWLYVPNTSIDDVVVHYPHDANLFYLRRNFERKTSKAGSYFADFRNTFNGRADGLSRNTVIYGHNLDLGDNPDAPYFAQLMRFLNEDFARANPYIYFSVAEEDLIWEVFAVYYATVELPYILPDFTDAGFLDILSEMKKRSQFIYDVEVGVDDNILTLSTCTYVFTPGVFPNRYRYAISARLVLEGEELREAASLVRNPAPARP